MFANSTKTEEREDEAKTSPHTHTQKPQIIMERFLQENCDHITDEIDEYPTPYYNEIGKCRWDGIIYDLGYLYTTDPKIPRHLQSSIDVWALNRSLLFEVWDVADDNGHISVYYFPPMDSEGTRVKERICEEIRTKTEEVCDCGYGCHSPPRMVRQHALG